MAKSAVIGRVYLASISSLLLLFLAWHYAIQEAANHTAHQQVQLWMQEIGATATAVQFRMLRGSLTIDDIQSSPSGGKIHIQQLFIKGNLASINAEHPLLHHIHIQQLTYDASALTKPWENFHVDVPPSLIRIFHHAKRITLQQGDIHHFGNFPRLNIDDMSISDHGSSKNITAHGTLASSNNPWSLNSVFHNETGEQHGQLSSLYHDIHSQAAWSGSWHDQTLQAKVALTLPITQAALSLHITQQNQQWKAHLEATVWPVDLPQLQTKVTGQGDFTGTFKQWLFKSKQLTWHATTLHQPQLQVAHLLSEGVVMDSEKKQLIIDHTTLKAVTLTFNSDQIVIPKTAWDIQLNNIDIQNLETTALFHGDPIKISGLNGWATAHNANIRFDLMSKGENKQFWRLQTKKDALAITAKNLPLLQLRSMLPEPIQKSAITLQGNTSLQLTTRPLQGWSTSGKVRISNMHIATKDKTFKTHKLQFNIQQADITGVHRASISAEKWQMQFPLTPRQAWSNRSYLDEWVSMPWQLQAITLSDGQVFIGDKLQPWLTQAQLRILNWQSATPAQLQLTATFGLAPVQADMSLIKSDTNNQMQWRTLNLHTKHANILALSDWLRISNFPDVVKGQLSLDIKASRQDESLTGTANIVFNRLQYLPKPLEHDFFLQYTGQTTQQITQQLTKRHKVQYSLPLHGLFSDDLSSILGQSFLQDTVFQLAAASSPMHNNSIKTKSLGSIRLHQKRKLSHNERTRLRKMIQVAKTQRRWHIELVPDLGTAQLNPGMEIEIQQTQSLIKTFMIQHGIRAQDVYLVSAQAEDRSTSSAGAIHIILMK